MNESELQPTSHIRLEMVMCDVYTDVCFLHLQEQLTKQSWEANL